MYGLQKEVTNAYIGMCVLEPLPISYQFWRRFTNAIRDKSVDKEKSRWVEDSVSEPKRNYRSGGSLGLAKARCAPHATLCFTRR